MKYLLSLTILLLISCNSNETKQPFQEERSTLPNRITDAKENAQSTSDEKQTTESDDMNLEEGDNVSVKVEGDVIKIELNKKTLTNSAIAGGTIYGSKKIYDFHRSVLGKTETELAKDIRLRTLNKLSKKNSTILAKRMKIATNNKAARTFTLVVAGAGVLHSLMDDDDTKKPQRERSTSH